MKGPSLLCVGGPLSGKIVNTPLSRVEFPIPNGRSIPFYLPQGVSPTVPSLPWSRESYSTFYVAYVWGLLKCEGTVLKWEHMPDDEARTAALGMMIAAIMVPHARMSFLSGL